MDFAPRRQLLLLHVLEMGVRHPAHHLHDGRLRRRHKDVPSLGAEDSSNVFDDQHRYQPRAALLFQVLQFFHRKHGALPGRIQHFRPVRLRTNPPSGGYILLYLPNLELHHRRVPAQSRGRNALGLFRALRVVFPPTCGRPHREECAPDSPIQAKPQSHARRHSLRHQQNIAGVFQKARRGGYAVPLRELHLFKRRGNHGNSVVLGGVFLRHSAVLRLFGIHRHCHRVGAPHGSSPHGKLPPPFVVGKPQRVLEQVAHLAHQLDPRLRVHSPVQDQ